MNITTVDGFDAFKASVTRPGDADASRVDLILSCVDNYEARITINQVWGGGAPGPRACLGMAPRLRAPGLHPRPARRAAWRQPHGPPRRSAAAARASVRPPQRRPRPKTLPPPQNPVRASRSPPERFAWSWARPGWRAA
jgi:hypothetical protein